MVPRGFANQLAVSMKQIIHAPSTVSAVVDRKSTVACARRRVRRPDPPRQRIHSALSPVSFPYGGQYRRGLAH